MFSTDHIDKTDPAAREGDRSAITETEVLFKQSLTTAARATGARFSALAAIEEGTISRVVCGEESVENLPEILKAAVEAESGAGDFLSCIAGSHSPEYREFRCTGEKAPLSLLALPVFRAGSVAGAVLLGKDPGSEFSPNDRAVLQCLAAHAATVTVAEECYGRVQVRCKEREERLKTMKQELDAAKFAAVLAERTKLSLFSNMSHELATPLHAIIGFSEVLKEQYFGPLNERQSEYVEDILVSARRLSDLINEILDISKFDSGESGLLLAEVDLAGLLQYSLETIHQKASRHGIRVDLESAPEMEGRFIRSDERKLKQAFFYLISNAARLTPDDGEMRLTAAEEKDRVFICVECEGNGESVQERERVFRELQQVPGNTQVKLEGPLLGLYLAKRVIESIGGHLTPESKGEQGRLTVSLPTRLEENQFRGDSLLGLA